LSALLTGFFNLKNNKILIKKKKKKKKPPRYNHIITINEAITKCLLSGDNFYGSSEAMGCHVHLGVRLILSTHNTGIYFSKRRN